VTLNTFHPAHGLCLYRYYIIITTRRRLRQCFILCVQIIIIIIIYERDYAGRYVYSGCRCRVVEGDFIIKTHNRRVSCLSNVYNIILLLRPDSYRRCTDKYNYPEYTSGYNGRLYIIKVHAYFYLKSQNKNFVQKKG